MQKGGVYTKFPRPRVPGSGSRLDGGSVSTQKLYALDSQVSELSRRLIQTGVTTARFIVFVNLGRLTSRRGSSYLPQRGTSHPRRLHRRHRSRRPFHLYRHHRVILRARSFVFRFIPVRGDERTTSMNICAVERTIKKLAVP